MRPGKLALVRLGIFSALAALTATGLLESFFESLLLSYGVPETFSVSLLFVSWDVPVTKIAAKALTYLALVLSAPLLPGLLARGVMWLARR